VWAVVGISQLDFSLRHFHRLQISVLKERIQNIVLCSDLIYKLLILYADNMDMDNQYFGNGYVFMEPDGNADLGENRPCNSVLLNKSVHGDIRQIKVTTYAQT